MATTATVCWADLNSELLVSIATAADNGLSLRDYNCLRGVCTAWRAALASPYPCLLSVANHRATVFSLPTRRSSRLWTAPHSTLDDESRDEGIVSHARVVGSGNGRVAVAIDHIVPHFTARNRSRVSCWTERIFLLGPRTGEEVQLLPPGRKGYDRVGKIVFAPNPDDGTVVAMYNVNKVAYVDTASSRDDDMNWTTIDVVSGFTEHLVDLLFDGAGGGPKVYCLDSCGGVRVVQISRGGRNKHVEPSLTLLAPFPGADVSTPPYDIAFPKNLFFIHGSLYQVWQNTGTTVRSGDGSTMSADEIFVLRYNPWRWWPYCWDMANDLGGCSVFVGKHNSPVVARAGAIPGVQADCLYWIDLGGVPMVCDVATGTSKPCVDLPYGACKANCWYFEVDNMTSIQPSTATRQTKRRAVQVKIAV